MRAKATATRQRNKAQLLSILVEAYEDENVEPLPGAKPQELVEFMAEQKGVRSRASKS
jgi:hypothetical protein